MKYFIGLDNGGTTTKAALFDCYGKEIAVASTSTDVIAEKPGYTERDMEEMWLANCNVIQELLKKAAISPEDVSGLGICGHGKGLYLWGKDNKPARYGIVSTDNRAYEYPIRWREDGTEAKVFELSCQHIMACQPVSLLAWLKDHEPETFENIQWVFECKDYVRFRLTGEAKAELTDYSGANLVNLHTRSYDDELLRLFGLEELRDCLPPLCQATEICGAVTREAAVQCGLKAGTPVIGGMFDIDACALAVGITDPENICMIAGTWSINEYVRQSPVTDGSVLMNSLYCIPEYYLIEECSPTSAGNNEWFIRQLLPELVAEAKQAGGSVYDWLNQWVAEIGPKTFVPVFLPFLMASNVHPNAKGTFVGVSASHTRKHLLRSIYEGIAFCHKYHLDKLLATRDTPPGCIRLAGGAAKSKVWTQMFADIMNLPVVTTNANETGALGCAIAAAAATGQYASLTEAVENMCSFSEMILPDAVAVPVYEKKYALYKKTLECLDPLWTDMQALIELT